MESRKTLNHSGDKPEKIPLSKLLKRDIIKLFWTTIYITVILLSAMFVVSLMPTLFAYLYSMCGNIIGIDFTKTTNTNIAFWTMCSLSTGSIIIVFIIFGLKKLLDKWTDIIINKHVSIKIKMDSMFNKK